jgi:hypothetical protein
VSRYSRPEKFEFNVASSVTSSQNPRTSLRGTSQRECDIELDAGISFAVLMIKRVVSVHRCGKAHPAANLCIVHFFSDAIT